MRERRKEGKEKECIKCSRGRRSYSRLLSPFHLQLPLYFPELSPGRQTPLSTSASTITSSRGILLLAMPACEAWMRATAEIRGPWRVLSHTQSFVTQLYGEIQNKNTFSYVSPGVLVLGHGTEPPERSHSQCRHPLSSKGKEMILLKAKASQTDWNSSIGTQTRKNLDFRSFTLTYWSSLFALSALVFLFSASWS